MTTATAPSAYPAPIEALMADARALADRLGDVPSRNALMKEFKIGAPKANAIREALTDERTTQPEPLVRPTGSLREQVQQVLDEHVPAGDPRDTLILTTLVGDLLDLSDIQRLTASNYVRTWKRSRDDARHAAVNYPGYPAEPLATERGETLPVRPLHIVPDLEPDTDTPEPAAPLDVEPVAEAIEAAPLATGDGHPGTNITPPDAPAAPPTKAPARRKPRSWPVWVLAMPAFVAIWSGWVGLGELTGFGVIHPLPGIADGFSINTAITLPIGVEAYAAYALAVWLSDAYGSSVRRFARWSAIGSLVFGAAGQVAYHLLSAAGVTSAPWWITTAVACLPVAVLGMGAALAHLIHANRD